MTRPVEGSPPTPDVTGWYLTEAQAALEAVGATALIIETGPPQRRTSSDKLRKPVREPIFGDWRVLRCRTGQANTALKLLVARELLGETRPEAASS